MRIESWAYLPLLFLLGGCKGEASAGAVSRAELGELLFSDTNLSRERTQSCATCHAPNLAFVDRRPWEGKVASASLGDDGVSLGDRNAPTALYARFIPPFRRTTRKRYNTDSDFSLYEGYVGGVFWDGRAQDLAEQAGGPPLNPVEMAMPSQESVVERLLEDPTYVDAFRANYGADIFDDAKAAYAAMSGAIAAFEATDAFSSFDSRYDRSLLPPGDERRYEYDPASRAAHGKALFFSTEFTNCAACHQLHAQGSSDATRELFTGFEYHNLGVPENTQLRAQNGASVDLGLGGLLKEESENGKFRTPTLRNVAVTMPYMHNGVFQELSTVLAFYEHTRRIARGGSDDSLNPETGEPWATPEVDQNLSETELASGNKDLTDEVNQLAMECFLMSLTDARYEGQLKTSLVDDCGL